MRKRQTGFTLVELLAAIMIIGVLSSILMVVVSGSREQADDVRKRGAVSVLNEAERNLQLYLTQTAPGLNVSNPPEASIPTDKANRLRGLLQYKFIATTINPRDVVYNGDGTWSATP